MKFKSATLTMICGVFFLLAAFNTNNENKTEVNNDKQANNEKQNNEFINKDEPCFGVIDNSQNYRIDSVDAMSYINSYQAYIDSVKCGLSKIPNAFPDEDEKLIYGVGTTICELKKIVASAAVQDSSEIWIMMGLMSSDSTEMIFALEGQDKAGKELWQYFDFTRPCPNSCPNWEGITNRP